MNDHDANAAALDDTDLLAVTTALREMFVIKNAARDDAIARSRELVRCCSEAIRAVHRREWDAAQAKLESARAAANTLRAGVVDHPDLYYAGYIQDALKEVVEAFITYAIVRGHPLPGPAELDVEIATYLNGLAEAATELRRFVLDILRREDSDSAEAERLLAWMDAIYDELVTFDFPDALTGGLRRQTDVVRSVLERTRGDLTMALRQQRLEAALARFEASAFGDG
ncbi:MAG: haloacid dehalogenase [Aggregatilineales bacterium]